jgi:ATP-dependent Zn protease
MFNFKQGVTKEIFIASLFLMFVIAIFLNQARYISRREKAKNSDIFDILDQGIPMDPSDSLINFNFETRRREALEEINQSLELLENPSNTNSSYTIKQYNDFLETHVGKRVVILFWADWNRSSIETLAQLSLLSSDPSFSILVIHQGKLSPSMQSILNEQRYDLSMIEDISGAIFNKHQVFLIPTTLFLDSKHTLSSALDGGISQQQIISVLKNIE